MKQESQTFAERSLLLNKEKEKLSTPIGRVLRSYWFNVHNMGIVIINSISAFVKG